MLFQEWIEAVSMAFDTNVSGAGIMVSFILIITIDLLILILATEKSGIPIVLIDTILILALVWAQWLPTFTGVVLALIWALVGAYIFKERVL